MVEAYSISSPMVSNCKLSRHGVDAFHDPTLYRSVVDALEYSTLTRSEISFVVNKVFQFITTPLDSHWIVVKKNIKISKGHLVSWFASSTHFCYKALSYSSIL